MKRSLLPALMLAFAAIAFTGCDSAITTYGGYRQFERR
jgi:hypothetical protein